MPTRLLCVLALAGIAGSCDPGGAELPPGAIDEGRRIFRVDASRRLQAVRAFAGLDGDPLPPAGAVPAPPDLTTLYRTRGVRHLRMSRGSECSVTLDAIFPSPNLAAGEPGPASFEGLDKAVLNAFENGMHPIWAAMYDIGEGSCEPHGDLERGRGVADPETWTAAVVRTLLHLRSGGVMPPLVEFYPDPFGAGGYNPNQVYQFVNLWSRFAAAVRAEFPPGAAGGPGFEVLAPGIPVEDPAVFSATDGPLAVFGAHIASTPADAPDIFSLASTASLPDGHLAIVDAARAALVRWGLPAVNVANLGVRPSDEVWDFVAQVLHTREERSAFLAAHLAATKVLLQDRVSLFAADRWGGPTSASGLPEDLFVREDGTSLPAMEAMLAFYLMESASAVALPVEYQDGKPHDGHGVAAMAATGEDGTIFLLAALADPGRVGQWRAIRFEVSGLPASVTGGRLLRAIVDATTTSFLWQEDSTVDVSGGRVAVERSAPVPSVLLVQLTPGASAATPASEPASPR